MCTCTVVQDSNLVIPLRTVYPETVWNASPSLYFLLWRSISARKMNGFFGRIHEFWALYMFSTKLQWILYVWRAWECLRRVRFISWPEENQFNGCHGPSINLSAQCRKCQTEVQSDDPLWFYCWSGDPNNTYSHGQSEPENSVTEFSES